ncbi:glycoside hydrolase family 19 protein [Flavobacterium hercynium]|uniref:YkuD domain-containing protein n=1 Tax=Flavobacterium hercynium TaxID=387094 RepID=A0A226GZZ9_9FLAO|nr:hypothetical protein [Flavobacterium hercynium]OXA87627.1 hypothetical protein B0A66_15950 [Flavobacterium hercynium]SMP11143.1 Predicted chitinase [Flavobacterium hercynium]
MSNFKIVGNANPTVGQKEMYSITDSFSVNLPTTNTVINNPLFPEAKVNWSMQQLVGGNWIVKENTKKTGNEVPYTFTEATLEYDDLKIVAEKNGQEVSMKIKPKKSLERKIATVTFLDENWNPPKRRFAYGDKLIARIHCVNLDGCHGKIVLYEDDEPYGTNTNYNRYSKFTTVPIYIEDGKAEAHFILNPNFAKLANAFGDKGYGKQEGEFHEYYITVEIFNQKPFESQNIEVRNPDYESPQILRENFHNNSKVNYYETKVEVLAQIREIGDSIREITNKALMVDVLDGVEENEETNSNCPNCNEDITLDEIKKICVDKNNNCLIANDTMIRSALPFLNTYRKKVGITTCVRKAHFLAQISQESHFYSLQENFNWYWKSLLKTYPSYFDQFETHAEKESEAKRLGRPNAAKNPGLTQDQQVKLANAIYGKTHPLGGLHINDGDGWLYSGKGFKQITWKGNYKELQNYFNANMKVNNEPDVNWIEGDNPYKLKNNAKNAITSALAFWGYNKINLVANSATTTSVENVTAKINTSKSTDIVNPRIEFFKNAIKVLKVKDCNPIKKDKNKICSYDEKFSANANEVYINIITTKDRNLQGPLIVFNESNILFKTHSLCRGSNKNKTKANGNGDTPVGRATTSYNSEKHKGELSYGNNGLIYLTGENGEFLTATRNGRNGIAIHSGHTVVYKDYIDDRGQLMSTYGCVRVYNNEMEKLGNLYTDLSNQGKKIYCYIEEYDGDIEDVYAFYDLPIDTKDSKRRNRANAQ